MSEQQNPSVGRIVHYVSSGSKDGYYASVCRAAIITELCDAEHEWGTPCVSLSVLNPEGVHFNQHVVQDEGNHTTPRTWHWPERN